MGLFGGKKSEIVTKRLDESVVPEEIRELRNQMTSRVAGQGRAVDQFVRVQETIMAGMTAENRPLGVFLFVGPTGSGKTHVVETFGEIQDVTVIKVDCAEFQHSHEIAKLIGAPPGYIGGEVEPKINKSAIEAKWAKSKNKYSIILFDEIEKGNTSVHQVLLGIMDRGTMTTGKNVQVDLSKCIIVMTSNLGSGEVKKLLRTSGGYGFVERNKEVVGGELALDDEIYRASKDAVQKFFSPEFFNRLDRMVVFRSLTEETLRKILNIELERVQDRLLKANKFVFVEVSNRGKDFLIEEGTSKEYGARELRRTIERRLVAKLTRAFATLQAVSGDMIVADKEPGIDGLTLDIAKGVMEVPQADAPVTTTAIVKKPKKTYIDPEDKNLPKPEPGKLDPEYCRRCGFRWYAAHLCFDLLDSPSSSALELYRREQEKRRKP
jgi:ATP-dependent Clp protease ATP-binding subunit ClpB